MEKKKSSSKAITALTVACAVTLGFVLGLSFSQEKPQVHPIADFKIEREAYHLVYDSQHKQAKWVYEHLTADRINGSADRSKFDFMEDPLIPALLRSTKEDYAKSGFDRGHLCPAADARTNDNAMKETFYLSNISPQCPQFNRGYWAQLEKHVRVLAQEHGSVHVYTGGLYLPREESDGKRYVRYQVIGPNDVAVPTHYFKIILDDRYKLIEAFVLPNQPISANTPLEQFTASLEKIEKSAGALFRSQ
ncbi:MAG: DNA/RNA non-specific endonuclease [Parachlamydiales bacterium]|nr:DNA/RNA non-specific endonuclease [Candidatus Acheromyda pituitae]